MLMNKDPLSRDYLKTLAPSVFAEHAEAKRSSKYSFIPTIRVVEKLAEEAWLPVMASEQRVRDLSRKGFQKHMLRFRKYDGTNPTLAVGDSFVEMVLINSHDGTSAYQLQAGLFRLVCSNGLVIADSTFENIKMKHQGFDPKDVLEASYRVIEDVPRIEKEVNSLSQVKLSVDEQMVFARSALALKYDDDKPSAVAAASLLVPRRHGDNKDDLWTTYNRVQENMIKGGIRGRRITESGDVRRTRTRAVKGIDENVKLNKALWALAEGMKSIKQAA
jgi:hypothetical protein